MNAAIIGATGYGGAELVRLLNGHPDMNVYSVHSSSQAGSDLADTYPHLQSENELILQDIDPVQIAKNVDVVFMATPSGISTKLSPQFLDAGVKVIDLSGDFRLKDGSQYEKWYKKDAATNEYLSKSVYGLPEWFKEEIKTADFIANPGCYPTATLLGLAPLMQALLVKENSIIVDAKSGTSGAGRTPSQVTHFPEMNDNFRIYKVNQHQHIPEIEQQLKMWNEAVATISFSTHLIPMTRGIMATIYAEAKTEIDIENLQQLYKEAYQHAPFVRIRKQGVFPSTKEVYGSNYCDIGLAYDDRTGRMMIVSVIDNLVKGAAGQAIQNMNLMFGFAENAGISQFPVYP